MTNLPLASRRYLVGDLDEQEYYQDELINSDFQSIFPLLKEAIHILKEFHPIPNLRDVNPKHIVEELPQNLWIHYVVNPAIEDIFQIVRQGGQEVHDSLVRALYDQDPFIKILAALVLLEFQNPGRRLVEQLVRAMDYLKTTEQNKPYYRDSGLIIIILLVLYQGGYPNAKAFVDDMLRKDNLSFEVMRRMWKNTILKYLFSALTPS